MEKHRERYLTTQQAAEYMGVSASYLAKARCDGNRINHTPAPPYTKVGKLIRYDITDLDKWIREHKVMA